MGNQQPGAGGLGGPGGNRNIEEERKRARERRQEECKFKPKFMPIYGLKFEILITAV
jgi:hypothetical protein